MNKTKGENHVHLWITQHLFIWQQNHSEEQFQYGNKASRPCKSKENNHQKGSRQDCQEDN